MKKSFSSAVLFVLALAGCSLAPEEKQPGLTVPAAYKAVSATADTAQPLDLQRGSWVEGTPASAAPRGAWWEQFGDKALNDLIARASVANQDVAAMAARVEQARQTARADGAALFPQVSAEAAGTRQKSSVTGATPSPQTIVQAGLGLGYEIDLFGRVRNTHRAAAANATAAAADFNSTLLALQADVAQVYFLLRGIDAEIAVLEEATSLNEESVRVLERRQAAGTVTALDTAQNIVEFENTRAALAGLRQQRAANENALAILLGVPPADFSLPRAGLPKTAPAVPPGLPSTLLQRRPDIAAAQYRLIAANARIGVARAAFFPSISLTGSMGYASDGLSDLFQWSNRTWLIGPMLDLPVFDGGRRLAASRRAEAQYNEAVALYRGVVLNAFRDVEDALQRLSMHDQQEASFIRAAQAAARARKIAAARYESGDSSVLEDIVARQNALAADRAVVQARTGRLVDTVQLVRALGGDFAGIGFTPAFSD